MNCEIWQQRILLSESGELQASEASELSRHLATCPDCRAFANDSRIIQSTAHQAIPHRDPSAETLLSIRKAAARGPLKGRLIPWSKPASWAACAATLMIAASAWWFTAGQQPQASSMTLRHLHALAAGLSSQTIGTDSPEGLAPATEEERLRRLGQQLLHMEGFISVETTEATDEPESLSPTVLLPHSTRGLPPKRCG